MCPVSFLRAPWSYGADQDSRSSPFESVALWRAFIAVSVSLPCILYGDGSHISGSKGGKTRVPATEIGPHLLRSGTGAISGSPTAIWLANGKSIQQTGLEASEMNQPCRGIDLELSLWLRGRNR